jgi:hypothetical protein
LAGSAWSGTKPRTVAASASRGLSMLDQAQAVVWFKNRSAICHPASAVASQMAALGIDRVVTGKVLNHASVDCDTVTGMIYDRHSYDAEKRRALERWAERLAEIVEPRTKTRQVIKLRP